jgi:hypothetical protein
MRNSLLATLCSFFVLSAACQQKTYDFSRIDPQKINISLLEKHQQKSKDSLLKNPVLDSLNQLEDFVNQKTKSYSGLFLGVAFPSANIDKINKELLSDGFNPLSSQFTQISLGVIHKQKKWIHEIMGNFSLRNTSTLENTSVKLKETELSYSLGWALIDLPWMTLFPFAGLSLQDAELTVDRIPSATIPSSGLFEISAGYTQTLIVKDLLNGMAGGEADFMLLRPKSSGKPGLMLSIRYALSVLQIDGRYSANAHRTPYFPDWSFNQTNLGLVLKMVGF